MFSVRWNCRRPRPGFTWLELVVVLLIIGVLIVLLLPAIQNDRGSGRNLCRNYLKQIGLALHNYHDTYGSLPPAVTYGPDGKAWHSWRTLLLPYIEQQELYKRYRFDEPWNSAHNQQLAKEAGTLPIFHCYADEDAATGETSYVVVTGDGTLWPRDRAVSLNDVPDGTSNTILVVELSDSGVHWMEPRDLPIDKMTFEIGAKQGVGIRSRHGGATHWIGEDDPTLANVLLGDGSVTGLVGTRTKSDILRSLLLIDDEGPGDDWQSQMFDTNK